MSKRAPEARTYTVYPGLKEKPQKPLPPVVDPFSFSSGPSVFSFPSSPFGVVFSGPATLPSRREREEEDRRHALQREQEKREREARKAQQRKQEKQAEQRQEAIRKYMAQQRALGIPDVLYVQLNGGIDEELPVYRNPQEPNQFWVTPGNPRHGIGTIVVDSTGRRDFKWISLDKTNQSIAQLMQRREFFPFSTRPRSGEAMDVGNDEVSEVSDVGDDDEPVVISKKSKEDVPQPTKGPEKRVEKGLLKLKPSREIQAIVKDMPEKLAEKEEELAGILSQPEQALEDQRRALILKARIAREQLQLIELEKQRLRQQKREQLEQEVKEFKLKRARQVEETDFTTLEAERQETQKRLERLTREIEEAKPEAVIERTERELEKVRSARARSEAIRNQVAKSQTLVDTINRRLFSVERARPRTWNEIISNLPAELRDFARVRLPPKIDPEEDVISVNHQKELVRAYLCGFTNVEKQHVPGFFELVLKLERGDCPL